MYRARGGCASVQITELKSREILREGGNTQGWRIDSNLEKRNKLEWIVAKNLVSIHSCLKTVQLKMALIFCLTLSLMFSDFNVVSGATVGLEKLEMVCATEKTFR